VIDLAHLRHLQEEWDWKPGSLRGTAAAATVMGLLPEIIKELRESRLILERTKPRVGW
jgi:hypothetical protein